MNLGLLTDPPTPGLRERLPNDSLTHDTLSKWYLGVTFLVREHSQNKNTKDQTNVVFNTPSHTHNDQPFNTNYCNIKDKLEKIQTSVFRKKIS